MAAANPAPKALIDKIAALPKDRIAESNTPWQFICAAHALLFEQSVIYRAACVIVPLAGLIAAGGWFCR